MKLIKNIVTALILLVIFSTLFLMAPFIWLTDMLIKLEKKMDELCGR